MKTISKMAIAVAGIMYSIPRPESPEEKSRNHLRGLHAQLIERKRTTIVGETGLPGWYQWMGESAAAELNEEGRHGGSTLRSQGATMLALLDTPQCGSYRIEGELRHLQAGGRVSAVGMFVGHWQANAKGKRVHVCALLRFNELLDEQAIHALYSKNIQGGGRPPAPAPAGNAIRLCPYVQVNRGGEALNDFELAGCTERYQRDPNGRWRHLVIELRPQSVRAFFDHKPAPMTMSKTEFEETTEPEIRNYGIGANASQPLFSPQGAAGVYVRDGAMSFRNVFIQSI